MLDNKDYCDYDTCVALRELGYNEPSNYTYCKHCRVSNEILAKYPGLSDSGYQDLIWDGLYTHDEVYKIYIEPLETYSRNSLINDCEIKLCSCVHLYEAQKFLRKEKRVEVNSCYDKGNDKWFYYVLFMDYPDLMGITASESKYDSYEEALLEGIKQIIEILKNETEKIN